MASLTIEEIEKEALKLFVENDGLADAAYDLSRSPEEYARIMAVEAGIELGVTDLLVKLRTAIKKKEEGNK